MNITILSKQNGQKAQMYETKIKAKWAEVGSVRIHDGNQNIHVQKLNSKFLWQNYG